jgi:RND family efflux transporter MFP subunit
MLLSDRFNLSWFQLFRRMQARVVRPAESEESQIKPMEDKVPDRLEHPMRSEAIAQPSFNLDRLDESGRFVESAGNRIARARGSKRAFWGIGTVLLVGGAGLLIWRGVRAEGTPKEITTLSPAVVNVATAQRETVADTVRIEAEFRPYVEDDLRVKVSGYLTNITVDIGDRVKKGQLLAEIEVPELQNELDHAKATEAKAKADHRQAELEYTRLLGVQRANPKVNLVSQQDLDNAEAKSLSSDAAIAAATAERKRLETMMAYMRVYAPYDGVITKRYADPGALIQAGTASDTQSMALVRISDNYLLRLDFPVSVLWVKDIKEGTPVDVEVESLEGKKFTGKVARFTRKVEMDTRKMWSEVEVPNPDLEIVPGMYAIVSIKANQHTNALTVPIQAVSSDQRRPTVLLVDKNNQVQERSVKLGIETPYRWEVLEGLTDGDRVIIGDRSQIKRGQKVETKPWPELTLK